MDKKGHTMHKDFVQALENDDIKSIKSFPKTDVHSHVMFSTRRQNVERWLGQSLVKPPVKMDGLEGMLTYVGTTLIPHIRNMNGFEFIADSAVKDAIQDGVVLLEISYDIRIAEFYPAGLQQFYDYVQCLVEKYRHQVELRPELGFSRKCADDKNLVRLTHKAIESGVFHSIDLYSHQDACPPEAVEPLFREAGKRGMKLKAHVGEFGGAEEIRRTVEVLRLDEVQHGIAAIESEEVMRWLSENNIQLNVCPTSNVMLRAVQDIDSHPIRVLFDNGVPVTINTDDLMIFDQTVSDEYRNLYQSGVFSAEELDSIRISSLRSVR